MSMVISTLKDKVENLILYKLAKLDAFKIGCELDMVVNIFHFFHELWDGSREIFYCM